MYSPADIMRDMKEEFRISINYMKAYRSKEATLESIRGSPKESYTILPSFLYIIQENNPVSVI